MLSYISQKFSKPPRTPSHEPRAALFLNRFSRTLTIMYATNSLVDILGIPANELTGKSFYYCIQENCLGEAVKCLESAKANDSIAYLRFWFRDPRQNDRSNQDERMSDAHSSGDEDEAGGVHLSETNNDHDGMENAIASDSSNSMRSSVERDQTYQLDSNSRSSSGNSTDGRNHNDVIFDQPAGHPSRTSSISTPEDSQVSGGSWSTSPSQIELEAVVSCTSDGLVVILRRAKPYIPQISGPAAAGLMHPYANGIFASPWASDPILPRMEDQWQQNQRPYLQPPLGGPGHPMAAQVNATAIKGPATEDFMNSIREVAVFAWSLTGINGSLEQYARGTPTGESQPPSGLPIWDPNSNAGPEIPRHNFDNYSKQSRNREHANVYSGQYQANGDTSNTYNNQSRVVPYGQRALQNGSGPDHYPSYNNCKQGNIPLNNIHHDQPESRQSWANQPSQRRAWDVPNPPDQLSNGLDDHYDIH